MRRNAARILACLALPFAATIAPAQSLNLDVGPNGTFPVPSAGYAAAGLAGTWNAVPAPANAVALVGIDGAPTAATVSSSGGFLGFDYDNFATTGDAQALLDDAQDVGGFTSAATWTFQGLLAGTYTVITYAWAPDNASFRTRVTVAGSFDSAQDVGGTWTGAHQRFVTFARHRVPVAGGTLAIDLQPVSGFGSLNGIQIVLEPDYLVACSGDGSGSACPCGNFGAPGHGCASSVTSTGGRLEASGVASVVNDTLVLDGTLMPNSSALYFQGSVASGGGAGVAFGDGLRCAGGAVQRLGTKINASGASRYPEGPDQTVSVRGMCVAGDQRVYQVWYRNAASFCTSDTFNLTNGVRVTWTN